MPFAQADAPSLNSIKTNHVLSVRRQCELLGFQRGQLYRKPVEKSQEEAERIERIMIHIDRLHTEMPYLGTRRIAHLLRQEGFNVGRKLVRRLMSEMAIYTVYPKPNLSKRNFKETTVPYLLRNKVVEFPNQVWSIDITYIPMGRKHMYLTAIIDWFSRKIVGWNLADTLDTMYVVKAVEDAIESHGCPTIINSDQGSQFTSGEYKRMLKEHHILQSMDGKSRWADNIMIERWFRSLKTEEIYINEYANPRELRIAVRNYIEQYNTRRPHEALDYATPAEVFAKAFADAAA